MYALRIKQHLTVWTSDSKINLPGSKITMRTLANASNMANVSNILEFTVLFNTKLTECFDVYVPRVLFAFSRPYRVMCHRSISWASSHQLMGPSAKLSLIKHHQHDWSILTTALPWWFSIHQPPIHSQGNMFNGVRLFNFWLVDTTGKPVLRTEISHWEEWL